MRPSAHLRKINPIPAFRGTAILSALGIWILGLLAVAPQWHESLHSDAYHQDHSCAVTLFNHGVEGAALGVSAASAPILFPVGESAVQPALPVAGADDLLPPGRGPPRR